MQNLPTAEVYQKEVEYMPWGILINKIEALITETVPQNGTVVDLLCGTGFLLGELQKKRPDIRYVGVDLESEFIEYAQQQYPLVNFQVADALTWESDIKFYAVICTGGLHHIPYEHQKEFIAKLSGLVAQNGFAVVADPYIDDYANEQERKLAAAKLGYEYLVATIKNGATDDVVEATASLIGNDVLKVEYKSAIKKIESYFKEYFKSVERYKTWPEADSEYGDYYFVLRN